jgi:hypothetical protein
MRPYLKGKSMPTKTQLFYGAVFFGVIMYDNIKTKIQAKTAAALYLEAQEGYEETQRANEAQISYLCHMLDENDVPVNEFDLIALNYNQ